MPSFLWRAVYDEMNDQFLLPLPSLACIRSSSFIRHGNPQTLERWAQEVLAFFLQLLLGHRSTRLLFAPWRGKCAHVVSCRGVFMGVSCLRCRLHSAQCVVEGVQTCSNPILAFLNAPKPTVLYCPCPISNPSCCIWKDHPTHRPPCKLVGMEGSAVLTAFQNYHKIGQWKTPLQFAHGIAFTMQHPSCSFSLVSTLTVRTRIHYYCNYALAHLGSVSRKMLKWYNERIMIFSAMPPALPWTIAGFALPGEAVVV